MLKQGKKSGLGIYTFKKTGDIEEAEFEDAKQEGYLVEYRHDRTLCAIHSKG